MTVFISQCNEKTYFITYCNLRKHHSNPPQIPDFVKVVGDLVSHVQSSRQARAYDLRLL